MKKLSKLKLQDVSVMSDAEMKMVVGGFVSTGSDGGSGGSEENVYTITCGNESYSITCLGPCEISEQGDCITLTCLGDGVGDSSSISCCND